MNRMSVVSGIVAIVALGAIGAGVVGARPAAGEGPSCCAETGGAGGAVVTKHTLSLDGANRVLAAAVEEAHRRGAGGSIAVVDDAGSLVAFARIDGTFAAGATVSIGKARTAAQFKKPTKAFEDAIRDGRTALVAVSELTPLQGGVPIEHEGQIVGAIGVSGAHSQAEDEQIAVAGAAALAATGVSAR
jgi:uncharacterized protein GlcG (DUF336 family)